MNRSLNSGIDTPVDCSDETIEQIVTTLWADLPHLFEQDISYNIYSQDIYFKDPVNTFKGKLNYRIIFWTLRFHARLFFQSIAFDLHSVTPVDRQTIVATWTVRGTLRLPWQPQLLFNGDSTYKLNPDCQIYEHRDTWDRAPIEILRQFGWRRGEHHKPPTPRERKDQG